MAVIRKQRPADLITALPPNEEAVPQVAAKLSGQIELGDVYAAPLDVYQRYDPNQTRLTRTGAEEDVQDELGEFNQVRREPDLPGQGLIQNCSWIELITSLRP